MHGLTQFVQGTGQPDSRACNMANELVCDVQMSLHQTEQHRVADIPNDVAAPDRPKCACHVHSLSVFLSYDLCRELELLLCMLQQNGASNCPAPRLST